MSCLLYADVAEKMWINQKCDNPDEVAGVYTHDTSSPFSLLSVTQSRISNNLSTLISIWHVGKAELKIIVLYSI